MEEVLTYEQVSISYQERPVVENISFSLKPGEILGIAGESGSGKSSVLRAAMGILGPGGSVSGGEICFRGHGMSRMSREELRRIRGGEIGMIFQDAKASFCPVRTIGDQIYESLSAHEKISRKDSDDRARELFEKIGLKNGRNILESYPFELSGGMNQRAGIACAMISRPSVLLADEPTSSLDMVAQKQVMEELKALQEINGTAVILVSHNLKLILGLADTVLVLHEGKMAEYGEAAQILSRPRAEYTKELLNAVPRLKRSE